MLTDQLNILRRAFDERLTALEAGLGDPSGSVPIETLVLDLARIAGDEADAAAREGVLLAQREANAQTAAAMADAQQAHVLLDGERSRCAALRTEIATLNEHLATAIAARREGEAARQKDAVDLTSTISTLREALAAATDRADVAAREISTLTVERDNLAVEKERLSSERADLVRAHEADAANEREVAGLTATLAQYREALEDARSAVADSVENAAAASARADAAVHDHEILVAERADFVRAHDALVLQRDTLAHERDDLVRERDKEIARLREELAAKNAAPPEKATAAAAMKAKAAAQVTGPERKSDRQAFTSALGVQIDGEAALLVNLSVTGAQVLSCASLKPAKTVKMLLPSSDSPVLCRGRIVWARLEPTTPGKPIRYRAGMFFTATDQAAVQTFITRHGARQ